MRGWSLISCTLAVRAENEKRILFSFSCEGESLCLLPPAHRHLPPPFFFSFSVCFVLFCYSLCCSFVLWVFVVVFFLGGGVWWRGRWHLFWGQTTVCGADKKPRTRTVLGGLENIPFHSIHACVCPTERKRSSMVCPR